MPDGGPTLDELCRAACAAPPSTRVLTSGEKGWRATSLQGVDTELGVGEQTPEVLLIYGKGVTLAGFPPWATHACELYHMGPVTRHSSPQLERRKVESALRKFECTERRSGR